MDGFGKREIKTSVKTTIVYCEGTKDSEKAKKTLNHSVKIHRHSMVKIFRYAFATVRDTISQCHLRMPCKIGNI